MIFFLVNVSEIHELLLAIHFCFSWAFFCISPQRSVCLSVCAQLSILVSLLASYLQIESFSIKVSLSVPVWLFFPEGASSHPKQPQSPRVTFQAWLLLKGP